MKPERTLTFFLLISVLAHAFVLFSFNVYIKAKRTPSFFVWPHIIVQQDLFFSQKATSLPQEVLFDDRQLRRRVFLVPGYFGEMKHVNLANLALTEAKTGAFKYMQIEATPSVDHVYLWRRRKMINPYKEETVSYKVLVSPQGKVVFSYPEKLPFSSQENLHFQAYLREAALFFTDRFCWTKLEGVVQ